MVRQVTVRESSRDSATLSDQSLALPGDWDKVQAVRNSSSFLLPAGTHWVESDVLGVSEEVYRVSRGRCQVASCSCGRCVEKGHFPHVVVESTRDGRTSPVFGFTRFGPHVVQRLREIHVSNAPNKKAMASNQKIREDQKKKSREFQQEKLEVVRSALASHKHNWVGPNGIRTRG